MRRLFMYIFICTTSVFLSCLGLTTNNPDKAFEYWTDIPLPNTEVQLIHGKYWKSGHFTLEYEAMFKMIASKEWVDELIEFNHLKPYSGKFSPFNTDNMPEWFIPPVGYKVYSDTEKYPHFYLWTRSEGDTIYIYNYQI